MAWRRLGGNSPLRSRDGRLRKDHEPTLYQCTATKYIKDSAFVYNYIYVCMCACACACARARARACACVQPTKQCKVTYLNNSFRICTRR